MTQVPAAGAGPVDEIPQSDESSGAKNPPVDATTASHLAQAGITQDKETGNFMKDGKVMTKPDGQPMNLDDVKAAATKDQSGQAAAGAPAADTPPPAGGNDEQADAGA